MNFIQHLSKRGFDSLRLHFFELYSGVEKWSSRKPHKLEIVGSNPTQRYNNILSGLSTAKNEAQMCEIFFSESSWAERDMTLELC